MGDHITASFDTLQDQCTMTAALYMSRAKREIDETFGDGYAAKNPALVAAFMQTAAADMNVATTGKIFGAVLREVSSQLGAIASAIENSSHE